MHWSDEGIVISARPHGETSLLCGLFTKERGRHMGLVRGGRSKALRPVCQAGNLVLVDWRARLDEHLGMFVLELSEPIASRHLTSPLALSGLSTLCSHLSLFAERDPHGGLYEGAVYLLSQLEDVSIWPGLLVRFELEVLSELGVGLDLSACAASGVRDDLVYVSPKSGRAVSREAGAPYHDKLLALPPFLINEQAPVSSQDILAGLTLTGAFFDKYFWAPGLEVSGAVSPSGRGEGVPFARQQLIKGLSRYFAAE